MGPCLTGKAIFQAYKIIAFGNQSLQHFHVYQSVIELITQLADILHRHEIMEFRLLAKVDIDKG